MDVFFEQIVPIKKKGKTILGFVGIWVLALLLCFVAFLFLGSFFIIVSAAAIYGAFVLSGKLNVEYEYIVTNTTMDVDKIINKSSRKRLLSFEIPSVTRLEKYNPAVPIKDPIIACNPEDENAYLMVCEKEGKSAQYLVFAPNAKLQSAIVKSLPNLLHLVHLSKGMCRMDVLTKDLIKLSEENAVQSGTFSYLELMKIAGDKATEIILQKIDVSNKRVAVLCGTGNNGGDGFVIARNLQEKGADVTVITPLGKPTTDSAKHYYKMLDSVEITDNLMGEYDVIIDALFGIGLNRELSQQVIKILEEINSYGAYKISIDIPSGIECDTGKILGAYFKADLVITFIAQKPCFYLPTANEFAGEIVVANIGVRPCTKKLKTIEPPIFKERDKNSHKGTYGTATMFCGSFGMAGAAILSSRACIRSGVGIAKCVVPKSIYHILTTAVPEAVCVVSPQTLNGTLCGFININKALEKATATLIGCGMGNNWHTQKLVCRLLNTAKIPTVIDADGINALVSNINVLKKTNASVIITPHPAEMSRLTGKTVKEIEQNRFKVAMDFAKKFNCYVVLKGANTIFATPDGQVFFNTCGNPGMATGGSGDVLAGIIVSFLAQGMDIIDAVKAAIYVHSNTADMVAKEIGEMALMPSDIIEAL